MISKAAIPVQCGGAEVPTLDKVTVDLMVVLGTTSMPVHQVMRLSRGAIIELDATERDEVKGLPNTRRIPRGGHRGGRGQGAGQQPADCQRRGAGRSQPDRGRSQANAAPEPRRQIGLAGL